MYHYIPRSKEQKKGETKMKRLAIIGNLTADIELEKVKDKSIAKITIAVNNGKDKEGKDRDATFIPVTVWDKLAENLAKYNKKGSKLYIEADIENNNYEKDGVKHFGFRFTAREIEYLSSKKED
jgi:single-strand DNA-binding protein